MRLQNVQQLFPSEDGNFAQQQEFLGLIDKLVRSMDSMKDPGKATLGEMKERTSDFYKQLIDTHEVPVQSQGMDHVVEELIELMKGHPYQTKHYLTNIIPMASIPGILGMLTAMLLNG